VPWSGETQGMSLRAQRRFAAMQKELQAAYALSGD
jgi:hypothetical protein